VECSDDHCARHLSVLVSNEVGTEQLLLFSGAPNIRGRKDHSEICTSKVRVAGASLSTELQGAFQQYVSASNSLSASTAP
jgi:hypothetical protein